MRSSVPHAARGRAPTRWRAISSASGAIWDRATGARCATWPGARCGASASCPRTAARRWPGWRARMRRWPSCSMVRLTDLRRSPRMSRWPLVALFPHGSRRCCRRCSMRRKRPRCSTARRLTCATIPRGPIRMHFAPYGRRSNSAMRCRVPRGCRATRLSRTARPGKRVRSTCRTGAARQSSRRASASRPRRW